MACRAVKRRGLNANGSHDELSFLLAGRHAHDRRGARGRAIAIRDAILTAQQADTSIEDALQRAIDAGIPPRQERLF